MSEQTKMDKLTTEMAEYICDKICRFPFELAEDELEEKCSECKMGEYVCHILNEYNETEADWKCPVCGCGRRLNLNGVEE